MTSTVSDVMLTDTRRDTDILVVKRDTDTLWRDSDADRDVTSRLPSFSVIRQKLFADRDVT